MNQQAQLEALAEQNRLLRKVLEGAVEYTALLDDFTQQAIQQALALPDLSTSILNQRDARVLTQATGVCEELLLGRSEFSTDEIFGIRCCIHGIERLAAEKEK